METLLTVLKSLPVIKDIGEGISKMATKVSHWWRNWRDKKESHALKGKKDRAKAAADLDDLFKS